MNEMPSCTKVIERKARKNHKCCECREVINKGDKYTYLSGIWNGEPADFKQCQKCVLLIEEAWALSQDFGFMPDEGPPLGEFLGWVADYGEQDGSNPMKEALGMSAKEG